MQRILLQPGALDEHAVAATVAILQSGGVVAAPTDTTYGLLADAEQPGAFARVFAVKRRDLSQPVPYLLADRAQVEAFLARPLSAAESAVATAFWPGPLTLIVRAGDAVLSHLQDARGTVGVRVPAHPFVQAVAEGVGGPLTGTSANVTGEPPATTAAAVEAMLGDAIDAVVDGGTADAEPSTVIDTTVKPWRVIRAGAVTIKAIRAVTDVVGRAQ